MHSDQLHTEGGEVGWMPEAKPTEEGICLGTEAAAQADRVSFQSRQGPK